MVEFRSRMVDVQKSQILWISGRPTSGKSWLGDYLQHYHGWYHLDGDEQQYLQSSSEAVRLYDQADEIKGTGIASAPAELWTPYLVNICLQALHIVKEKDTNLVITRAFHDKEQAQFVRSFLQNHGKYVVLVELKISDEEFVRRSKVRCRKKASINGLSIEQYWERRNKQKCGEFNEENEDCFIKSMMVGWVGSLV